MVSKQDRRKRQREQLWRELGFDELSYEACLVDLFGDIFEVPKKPGGGNRSVSQAGPARRGGGGVEAEVDPEQGDERERRKGRAGEAE